MCHTHVSHKWLCHSDAVYKRWHCPDALPQHQRAKKDCAIGAAQAPQAPTSDALSWSIRRCNGLQHRRRNPQTMHDVHAGALCMRGLRLAGPGITTERRGLSETQNRLGDRLHNRCCRRTRCGSGRVRRILHCSSSPRRRSASCLLIAKPHTTGEKSQTHEPKASCIVTLVWTAGGRPHPAVT